METRYHGRTYPCWVAVWEQQQKRGAASKLGTVSNILSSPIFNPPFTTN
jgi:hypothetical protein